jgi:hypothetical protein
MQNAKMPDGQIPKQPDSPNLQSKKKAKYATIGGKPDSRQRARAFLP